MKTFYSVKYRNWGADKPYIRWFDKKEEALKFANHDYRDKPIAHCFKKESSIKEIEEIIKNY